MKLAKYLGSMRLKNRDEEISGKLVSQESLSSVAITTCPSLSDL